MANGKISKRTVDGFTCPDTKDRDFLWDSALEGFGACAYLSGRKVYVVQYRQNGRSRRVNIGDCARLTPEQARSEAKKMLGAVETGADPIAERKAKRAVPTFSEVADDFIKLHVAMRRKGRTQDVYEGLLRNHIKPAFGSKSVTDVRLADVARLQTRMTASPGAANRAVSLVSAIWNWASRREIVDRHRNPAVGIERNREQKKERFLTTEELGLIGSALAEGETVGLPYVVDETKAKAKHAPKPENRLVKLDPFAVGAIRLLILTGARLREILDAQWAWVDAERGILFLPDSKTGRKPVYLSAAALAVLASLPRIEGNPFIIAGQGPRKKPADASDGEKRPAPRSDLKKPWAAVCRAAGLDGVRLHDLRHSFASVGAGASLGLPVIGKLLGHTQAATTARYAHLDADPLRRAADTIGATIAAALDGKKGGEVVPISDAKQGRTK